MDSLKHPRTDELDSKHVQSMEDVAQAPEPHLSITAPSNVQSTVVSSSSHHSSSVSLSSVQCTSSLPPINGICEDAQSSPIVGKDTTLGMYCIVPF